MLKHLADDAVLLGQRIERALDLGLFYSVLREVVCHHLHVERAVLLREEAQDLAVRLHAN